MNPHEDDPHYHDSVRLSYGCLVAIVIACIVLGMFAAFLAPVWIP